MLLLRRLVFDDLPAPAIPVSNLHNPIKLTYYRLGKNRSGSGILYRTSRSALTFQAIAVNPAMTNPNTAVLAFQLCGCAYQPPDGDQTCFG